LGEFFTSFDDSWRHFLGREEPMESFLDEFLEEPEDVLLAGWLVALDPAVVPEVERVQAALAHLDWVRPIPDHFLHVWIGGVAYPADPSAMEAEFERGRAALADAGPFSITYPRLNCFHTAVVAEAESEGPRMVHELLWPERDRSVFLPHLTIAVPVEPGPPEPLRETLVPMRQTALGEQTVTELILCLVPASRRTILDPWAEFGRAFL